MQKVHKYGPWALIAGASEGIGAAFARELSARGLSVVLVARRVEPLEALAASLPGESRVVAADLATDLDVVQAATADLEIGLVVANAASSPIGAFERTPEEELNRALDLNCRVPMLLARRFLPSMVERGRGGLIVMSSLAGGQGSPGLAAYAGTKAFGAVFAESLWGELRPKGVDVLTCVAGAVSTPNLQQASQKAAPGTVTSEVVAVTALNALGRRPRVVPGSMMKFSSVLMARVLPKRMAITVMGRAAKDVLG